MKDKGERAKFNNHANKKINKTKEVKEVHHFYLF